MNIHFHSLVLAGVYTRPTPTARRIFHRLPPPTDADILALLTRLHHRVRRLLARRDRLPEAAPATDPFAAQDPLLATAVAAALQGRVALRPRAGPLLRRLRSASLAAPTSPRCARLEGFSLHANVAVRVHRRDQLEPLCRSLVRPPISKAPRMRSPSHSKTLSMVFGPLTRSAVYPPAAPRKAGPS